MANLRSDSAAPAALNPAENITPEVAPATPLEFPVQVSEESQTPDDSRNPFADLQSLSTSQSLNHIQKRNRTNRNLPSGSVSQAAAVPADNIAPTAPVEIAVPLEAARQVPAASMGLWNILFIGGLLVAGSMILIGLPDLKIESLSSESSAVTYAANTENVVRNFAAPGESADRAGDKSDSARPRRRSQCPALAAATGRPCKAPYGHQRIRPVSETQAWFGGDWRSTEGRGFCFLNGLRAGRAACDSVIVAAGIDHRGQVDAPSMYLMEDGC